MNERDQGYDRGWYRYGFGTMEFNQRSIHGGGADIGISSAFNRGAGKASIAYGVVYPGASSPPIGMHIHRDEPSGEDLEEWYVIVDGTGVMRFSNGDSVEFGPGDLLACYPGTGHSLEATSDEPVRLLSITPATFTSSSATVIDVLPERFKPRIEVIAIDSTKNPLSAKCSVCGSTWERPDDDRGANSLPAWSVQHQCTQPFTPIHQ